MMRNFILGTDWCTDCDDAVAVRILARAHKSGKICIKGIGVNACMEYSAASLDGFLNTENWLQRYSARGCDCINKMISSGVDVKRFDLYLSRLKLNLYSNFKQRSPADCKFLQFTLKNEFGFEELPSNMMPVAQLEASVGTLLAEEKLKGNVKTVFQFKGLDVINKI